MNKVERLERGEGARSKILYVLQHQQLFISTSVCFRWIFLILLNYCAFSLPMMNRYSVKLKYVLAIVSQFNTILYCTQLKGE